MHNNRTHAIDANKRVIIGERKSKENKRIQIIYWYLFARKCLSVVIVTCALLFLSAAQAITDCMWLSAID